MVQIIVVDSAPDEAAILGEALRAGSTGDREIEVTALASAREAVDSAVRKGCDVVVADLNLPRPGWSGPYLLRRIREVCPRARSFLISETDAWEPFVRDAADGLIVRNSSSGLAEQLFRALHLADFEATQVSDRPAGPTDELTAPSPKMVELKDRTSGIGDRIAGKYRLDAELGHGGMGIVYRAMDTFIGRRVAVKLLKFPAALAGPEMRERMRREVMITGRLSHPNLVTLFDAGIDRGEIYIVLELIEGESLKEKLLRRPLWSLAEALPLAVQILDALEHSHSVGIVHRDLKPGNVLITPEGRAKVVDFGIAKLLSLAVESAALPVAPDMTSPGTVLGTPAYMAPEQFHAAEVGVQTDLYALGAVLFEMLQGCPLSAIHSPFSRERRPPLPLVGKNSRLTALLERALAVAAEERFASAAEMKTALLGVETTEKEGTGSWWKSGGAKK